MEEKLDTVQAIILLQKARIEIVELRKRIEILSQRNEVMEIFAAALGFKRGGECMSVDVVWEIERLLEHNK